MPYGYPTEYVASAWLVSRLALAFTWLSSPCCFAGRGFFHGSALQLAVVAPGRNLGHFWQGLLCAWRNSSGGEFFHPLFPIRYLPWLQRGRLGSSAL
jgi:hypothetical protein